MLCSSSQDPQPSANGRVPPHAVSDSQNLNTGSASRAQGERRNVKKSNQICRFYGTKKGCKAQDQCPYRHIQKPDVTLHIADDAQLNASSSQIEEQTTSAPSATQDVAAQRELNSKRVRAPVSKPVPPLQQKDPREFQISQVVRRFSPTRTESGEATTLKLNLQPSDPDFPFELNTLDCTLIIPLTYPRDGRPSIRVNNKEIPRGFQINVEQGFATLCSGSNKTLLQLLNDLDRNLERFLASEKAQTVKIVANRKKEERDPPPTTNSVQQTPASATVSEPAPAHLLSTSVQTIPKWSVEERANAKAKRDTEIRQLEARMSRLPLFSRSNDGVTFNVPLQIPKPSRLPNSLQSLKQATLIVPQSYGLEPCRIQLKGVTGPEAQNVETAFEKRASDQKNMTLMAHINYLTQNIHLMAVPLTSNSGVVETSQPTTNSTQRQLEQPSAKVERSRLEEGIADEIVDEDRPHLRFISQPPPEWNLSSNREGESHSESSDDSDSDEDISDASDGAESQAGGASVPTASSTMLEKGVLLSFPHLELHGVELLELHDISLSVKCDRCKETLDIKNIKSADSMSTSIRTESCKKCANPLSLSYRSELLHANSIKAGYLDLEGCSVVDMLPSHFVPTCSECSTTHPLPGITSVRGEAPLAVCRECHHRLNFKIPEVKFLRVASNDPRLALPLRSKRKKENLGITAGTELPERGHCKHYAKSYRWFRFSCCNRVYPCDKCHDEKEEHLNEHANRMICGWCSREQNYRPEDCHACGRSVIRKTGGGFWEGGKGTRDKNKMSRKDPRKYKRIGGGAS